MLLVVVAGSCVGEVAAGLVLCAVCCLLIVVFIGCGSCLLLVVFAVVVNCGSLLVACSLMLFIDVACSVLVVVVACGVFVCAFVVRCCDRY